MFKALLFSVPPLEIVRKSFVKNVPMPKETVQGFVTSENGN